MIVDQALHEKIEAYLLGKLPPQEAAAFEADIQNDPQLAEEVELHRLILPVPDRLAELELHEDFARWRSEMEPDPPPEQLSAKRRRYFTVAMAILLLLLSAGAFWLWRHYEAQLAHEREERIRLEKELGTEKLRRENAERENGQLREDIRNLQAPDKPVKTSPGGGEGNGNPVVVTPPPIPEPEYVEIADQELIAYADDLLESVRTRGKGSDDKSEGLIVKASSSIADGKYRDAQRHLAQIRDKDKMYYTSLEMLAYVYFKRKQYTQAVNTYLQYRKFNNDTDKTDWDLCLFYLGDYQRYKSEFQSLLQKIINDDKHPKRDKALALRDTLANKGIWPR